MPKGGLSLIAEERAGEPQLAEPLAGVTPDDLFVITFTSGTTGRPKGVCHTVGSLVGAALAFNQANGVGPEHRYYHVLSMSYMAGLLNTLLCPFLAGAAVAVDEPFGPQSALRFWIAPRRYQLNTLWVVPTICTALLRLDRDSAGQDYCRRQVRLACVGTAPLPGRVRDEFEVKYGVPLYESYGLSETLFVAANVPGAVRRPGSVGSLLPGVELRATDDLGNPLPAAQDGEMQVRTPYRMAGYLDPACGRPVPPPGGPWFATGDIGYQGNDGCVFITGRKKDIIIRGGLNISPRGIEEVLLEYPAVQEAAVVGVPHAFYGEEVLAALQLRPGVELAGVQDELTTLCRRSLCPLAVPGRFVQVEDFPRTSTGKVSKAELRARLLASAEGVKL
jgi:long-chain acyl-CoA synthetase